MEHRWDFPGGPVFKNPSANTGDTGSVPGLLVQELKSHMPRDKPMYHNY